MKLARLFGLALLAAVPVGLDAQAYDPAVGAMRQEWSYIIVNIRKAAEQFPEGDYKYRPVETVRTFGQTLGHIVDAQLSLCAVALGEKSVVSSEIERTVTTKADLLKKLMESTAFCSRAYGQALNDTTLRPGERTSRYGALIHNTAHNDEHYGNLVTYMRIKGLVPPSTPP